MIFESSKEKLFLALQEGNFGSLIKFAKITQNQLDSLNQHRAQLNQDWRLIASRHLTINAQTVRHIASSRIKKDKLTPSEIIYIAENVFCGESLVCHGKNNNFILENPNILVLDGQSFRPRAIIKAGENDQNFIIRTLIPKGWQARKRKK